MTRDERQRPDGPECPLHIELDHDHHLFITGGIEPVQRVANALRQAEPSGIEPPAAPDPPPPPSGVQAFELPGPKALLSWQSVLSAASYRVLRDRAVLEPPVQGQGIYVDDTVRAGASYVYAVAAEGADRRLARPPCRSNSWLLLAEWTPLQNPKPS